MTVEPSPGKTVEVVNLFQGYDSSWNWGTKRDTVKLSRRCFDRLVHEAQEHFDGFGLDFSQFGPATVSLLDGIIAQIEWTHNASGKTLTLLEVWFDKKTGAINQCGQNYGGLVS